MKKILFLALLLFAAPAFGAVSVGPPVTYNSDVSGAANDYNITVDVGSSSDRVLYVFIGEAGDSTSIGFPTVTFNSDAMTRIEDNVSVPQGLGVSAWRLINPDAGSHTLTIDWSGAGTVPVFVSAIPLSGVDQVTPNDTPTEANGSGSPASNNVTSASGDLVIDVIMSAGTGGGWTLAVGADQTAHTLFSGTTLNGSARNFGVSTEAGAATTTMSWTGSQMGNWRWIGLNVNAASGGGGGSTLRHRRVVTP